MGYWIYFILALICASAAFSMASAKRRGVISWTLSCFSMPFMLLALFLFPSKDGDEPPMGILSIVGMLCAAVCSLWGVAELTGADRMLLGPLAMPLCESDDAHGMVAERWVTEMVMSGSSPIIGLSGEKMTSDTPTRRTCEADTVGLDGGQHHVRYVISREPGHNPTVITVTMLR